MSPWLDKESEEAHPKFGRAVKRATARDFSSSLDADLWTHLILQRGHNEPVIRNALVTLSSLHKGYLFGGLHNQPAKLDSTEGHSTRNLSLVARSHRHLRNYLFRPDASHEVALICSIIFYAFESLLGEPERAIQHLDHGLRLLKQCQSELAINNDNFGLPKRLVALYQRLDVQASSFNDARRPMLTLCTSAERAGSISIVPPSFHDLHHAEEVLTKLENWVLHHIIEHVDLKSCPWDEFALSILDERQVLATQFDKYGYALERLGTLIEMKLQWADPMVQQEQMAPFLFLRTHYYLFHSVVNENLPRRLQLKTIWQSDESCQTNACFPMCSSDHNGSLRLALSDVLRLSLIKSGSVVQPTVKAKASATLPLPSGHSSSHRRTFTLSSQIVAALYFTCLKTTDPEIFSRAREALSSIHGRDGLWDAEMVSFIVEELFKSYPSNQHSASSSTTLVSDVGSQQGEVISNSSGFDSPYQLDQFCRGAHEGRGTPPHGAEAMLGTRLEDIGAGVIDASDGLEGVLQQLRAKLIIRK
ncbi:uncharacterized protein A1O9_11376 [Exophiala aquamarina CBS 119918]|uniref:Transcription factor domain-containing protein n=1 Tax=Exophiala aquamarina CBS 119918 TaxID=1182545 RepID=A0A072NXD2_9EURO|nr:uncharacterized protein A1O9_11376 [Exophiala aquamarina CBS 119918]KEF52534.1 hypothetical protein A1O9_11376 [Exophiala aquamarina CBS 119918]